MRLPNGFGSVYKLSGKRRKPWAARKTVDWALDAETRKAYPVYQFIGFYETRQEALTALVDYNKDPYDLHTDTITFSELYERWSEEHYPTVSQSTQKMYTHAYNACAKIKDMHIRDIKLDHLQMLVDASGKNTPVLKNIKLLIGQVYAYAVKHEVIDAGRKELVSYIDINKPGNPHALDRVPFSAEEIGRLWELVWSDEYAMLPLILIYTGLRVGEMYNLKKEDMHLEDRWLYVREAKTKAGIREVPIADKILPLVAHWVNKPDQEHVFTNKSGAPLVDATYRPLYWWPLMRSIGVEHRPHDTRHTCVSRLVQEGVDERTIKSIVGHKGKGVTETVYTHIGLQQKLDAVNKI